MKKVGFNKLQLVQSLLRFTVDYWPITFDDDDDDEGRIPPDGTLFGWDRKKKFVF